jgi:MarR-like DNA-binding transcriptional regulator SgrR of sgrS sRNA
MSFPFLLPKLKSSQAARVEMNKTLETIRGSWITRDREAAETNRAVLRNSIDQISVELHDKFLSVLDWAERTEQFSDLVLDEACNESYWRLNEIGFLEKQTKILIQAIRETKDVDSIKVLRATTRETIERIEERKREEKLKRLQEEQAAFVCSGQSTSHAP